MVWLDAGAITGVPGQAATVTVGGVTTLPAGSQATAENAGTSSDCILNLGIPRGADGQAATIEIESTTTLPPGSQANVVNRASPDSSHALLQFYIPRGDVGPSGDTAQGITINSAASATSGTLTEEQLTTLQASDQNYIIFNNEIYRLEDKQHDTGFLIYSHTGQDSTKTMFIKEITITISTRGWVLSKLQPQAYNANTIIGTTSGESSNYVINTNSFRIESGVPV